MRGRGAELLAVCKGVLPRVCCPGAWRARMTRPHETSPVTWQLQR